MYVHVVQSTSMTLELNHEDEHVSEKGGSIKLIIRSSTLDNGFRPTATPPTSKSFPLTCPSSSAYHQTRCPSTAFLIRRPLSRENPSWHLSSFTCFSFLNPPPTPTPEIEQPIRTFSQIQEQAKMLLLWHLAEILVFPVTPHYIRWFPPRVSSTWRDHPTPPLPPVCPTVRHWTDCLCAL